MTRDCGAWINLLAHQVKKRMNATLSDLGITGVQSRVMHYILEHGQDGPVFQRDVEAATRGLNVIGQSTVGGLVTSYIFDTPPKQTASLEIHPLSLQDFFIQMVGHKGGAAK